ncbi:TIGR03083 family protein [Nonomuraea solani]|uniref:TIGR03083 family protein n=1 Tax=Nonomuraea solani TaxID=1144553 RepID=A0A1H6DZE3_9ACTN|nr:maleylpyruvate isomerase family mycothiol-dependent enzyme [Nonomuraea solani]SEG90561.1 TIGR03083 family protein [Nonomuraea solani]
MNEWDATSYAGKDTILRVVRDEAERLFALAEPEEAWEAPTACTGWTTRDVVAHIVDTTEGYFAAFEAARGGGELGTAYGLPGMGARVNDQAMALRGVPQKELLDRLKTDFERMQAILRDLGEDEWSGLTVPHFYMGPLPAYFYAAGQLMDYAVHSWDVRQGTGRAHGLPGESADLLVPFMFVLWQSTIKQGADLTPFDVGIRVGGVNGGDFRVSVGAEGMTYRQANLDGLPAVIEFDAGSMVLTTFGRSNSGTVRGDLAIADRYLNLFFRI